MSTDRAELERRLVEAADNRRKAVGAYYRDVVLAALALADALRDEQEKQDD